jgi:hypothetical protein
MIRRRRKRRKTRLSQQFSSPVRKDRYVERRKIRLLRGQKVNDRGRVSWKPNPRKGENNIQLPISVSKTKERALSEGTYQKVYAKSDLNSNYWKRDNPEIAHLRNGKRLDPTADRVKAAWMCGIVTIRLRSKTHMHRKYARYFRPIPGFNAQVRVEEIPSRLSSHFVRWMNTTGTTCINVFGSLLNASRKGDPFLSRIVSLSEGSGMFAEQAKHQIDGERRLPPNS